MEQLFRACRHLISENKTDLLKDINIRKPEQFNWVTEVFENINLKDHPGKPALMWTDGNTDRVFSFSDLEMKYNRLLNFLRRQGLQQNDAIFSQLPLLPENWLCYLAVIKGGFRLVPAPVILSVEDIVYRFGKLLPKAVVADPESASKIDEAEELSGESIPVKIIVAGERAGWIPFENYLSESPVAEAAVTNADDPLFLFFTSGTTGMPKIVMHTHLSYPLGHLTTAAWIGLSHDDVHYNISQPGWAKFAWSSFFAPWNMGSCIFSFSPPGRFIAAEQLSIIQEYPVTTFCAPPTVLRMLIQEDLSGYKLNLRECVAAGEPLNPEIINAWKLGTGIIIRDGYGQTESSCLVANHKGQVIKPGSMGKPCFLYDIVISDDEGNEMPVHEEGYITVKTTGNRPDGIFSGYFDFPGKKKEVFRHGLYYTGDKAYKDEDGYIWFVGRDDDVIKTSDYRVGPFEVESVLLKHEAVMESAVIGSPHPIKGCEVKAFIILSAGHSPSDKLAAEVFAFARKNMAPYKMPRIIQFVAELPKTISGKIRRAELKAAEAHDKAEKNTLPSEYFYT